MKKKIKYSLIPGTLGLMIVLNSGIAYATEDDVSDSIVNNTETDDEKIFTSPELEKEIKYTPYETKVNYSDKLAYGDYRVEQEGVLGENVEGEENKAPQNKIITVGTNKDLVEKIKYNERYNIENPVTFSYTEHALRNIQLTGKGLQRNIYLGTEEFRDKDDSNSPLLQTIITISDGDLITKDIEDYVKLKKSDKDAKLNENLFLGSNSTQGYAWQDISDYVDALYDLKQTSYDVKKMSSAKEVSDFILNKFKNGMTENHISVNNNFKTPIIKVNGNQLYTYLDETTFREVYSNIMEYKESQGKNIQHLYSIQSFYNDFIESPKTIQSKAYELANKESSNKWATFETRVDQVEKEIDETMQINANFLRPEKVYKVSSMLHNYTADKLKDLDAKDANSEINFTLMNYINNDKKPYYFYYNTQNIPYRSDISLGFKQTVEENTDKKNILTGQDYGLGELNELYSYQYPEIKKTNSKEDFELIDSFVRKDFKNYLKFLQSNELNENRFEKLENIYKNFAKNANTNILDNSNSNTELDVYTEGASREFLKFLGNDSWTNRVPVKRIGTVDTKTEEFDFKTIKKEDPELAKGKTRVETKGVKGKKVTKIYYKLNRMTGELTDPIEDVVEDTKPIDEVIYVGTKKVTTPAKPIEDIAKTTKITKEVIKSKTKYEADDSLDFEKHKTIRASIDGEKEITTVSQKGKDDVVTEKIIKEPKDGLVKVGNKKVDVKKDGEVTITTTTIYEVDPITGKLQNPKIDIKKTIDPKPIDYVAKTTKTRKEIIKAKTKYEADDTLKYGEQKIIVKALDGEKEITTVSQKDKDDIETEKVIKEPIDGLIRVGNKKIEKDKDGYTIITTYEVDPTTGELINPTIEKVTNDNEIIKAKENVKTGVTGTESAIVTALLASISLLASNKKKKTK